MSSGDGADYVEEDVNSLQFGKDFDGVSFLSNTATAVLLETLAATKYKQSGLRPPEPYAKSLAYAQAHMGAVHLRDAAAIDDLFSSLRSLEFDRVNEETGEEGKAKLHEYQIVSLSNLNPGSVAAARSLIPSLIVFTDDEVGEMLSALRRSSAKYSGLDAAAPGLGQ